VNLPKVLLCLSLFVVLAGCADLENTTTDDTRHTDCDTMVAYPTDPALLVGVFDKNIDTPKALPACQAALEKYPDSPRLHYKLGLIYNQDKRVAEAVSEFRKAAEAGYAPAQTMLGVLLGQVQRNGDVPKDAAEAVEWFRKAAAQGDAPAQCYLGLWYLLGCGVPKDYAQAAEWLRKSADQGFARAQEGLAFLYLYGFGVPKDQKQADEWFRKAEEQRKTTAQNSFTYGERPALAPQTKAAPRAIPEIPPQMQKIYASMAAHWRQAADRGDANAQNNLGNAYENGRGVEKNAAQAASWFRKAAEQGYAAAQFNLGRMYQQGRGVEKDEAKAASWFRKAADQGFAPAREALRRLENVHSSGKSDESSSGIDVIPISIKNLNSKNQINQFLYRL